MESFTWVSDQGGKAETSLLTSALLLAGELDLFLDRWRVGGPVVRSRSSTPPADGAVSPLERSWSSPAALAPPMHMVVLSS